MFYVFVFPLATALFYAVTLGYRVLMNFIQQKIQDKTPLPQEEAIKIIRENSKIQLELDTTLSKIEKIKNDYEVKESELNTKHIQEQTTLKASLNGAIKSKTQDIQNKLDTTNSIIEDNGKEIMQNREIISKLKKLEKSLKNELADLHKIRTDNEVKIQGSKEIISQLKLDNKKLQKEIKALNLDSTISDDFSFINDVIKRYETTNKTSSNQFNKEQISVLSVFAKNDSK